MKISKKYIIRFEKLFHKRLTGCWPWKSSLTELGTKDEYARFNINGKTYPAHRVSYLIYKGRIPKGLNVCHSCDNKFCVNPNHLWLGTQDENLVDCRRKQRHMYGEAHTGTKLREHDIVAIRKSILFIKDIGKEYGISIATVSRIRNRKLWTHVK